MTPEEITKLAEEYAEAQCGSNSPVCLIREKIQMEEKLRWLLRTHCIVSKEKVRNHYNMAKSNIKPQYIEACQYKVGATQVLESIFDPDTFNETYK